MINPSWVILKTSLQENFHQFGAKMKIWKIKGKGAVCMNKKGG